MSTRYVVKHIIQDFTFYLGKHDTWVVDRVLALPHDERTAKNLMLYWSDKIEKEAKISVEPR